MKKNHATWRRPAIVAGVLALGVLASCGPASTGADIYGLQTGNALAGEFDASSPNSPGSGASPEAIALAAAPPPPTYAVLPAGRAHLSASTTLYVRPWWSPGFPIVGPIGSINSDPFYDECQIVVVGHSPGWVVTLAPNGSPWRFPTFAPWPVSCG